MSTEGDIYNIHNTLFLGTRGRCFNLFVLEKIRTTEGDIYNNKLKTWNVTNVVNKFLQGLDYTLF